jgi:hypothetical protein
MWEMWEIVLQENTKKNSSPGLFAWLKCKMCSILLAPSNPSRTFKEHYSKLKTLGICNGQKVSSKVDATAKQQQQLKLDMMVLGGLARTGAWEIRIGCTFHLKGRPGLAWPGPAWPGLICMHGESASVLQSI